MSRALWLLVLVLALGGCDQLATEATADQRVVGIIQWEQPPAVSPGVFVAPAVIEAPDTVHAGQPFTVTVNTIGMSGCWRADGADLSRAGATAAITPFDRLPISIEGEGGFCTGALVSLPRTVQVVFNQAGAALLRVNGRRLTGADFGSAVPATLEKQIFVR